MQNLASMLEYRIDRFPIVYLDIPLGDKHKELEICDRIVGKTEKKISECKTQYLSQGGTITLTNSLLDPLPTYVMSLLPIPSEVENKLDKLRSFCG